MSRAIAVDVTQEDIDNGAPHSCAQCPIARAMRRAGLHDPYVPGGRRVFWGWGGCRRGRVPETVRQFTMDFDVGQPAQPFTFTIDEESP